ncbi:anti-sigma factor [Aureimonas populi]|uniref:Anti-sigma factor domain-containing protein n=1 Tax=Aureimonas populi TaxID=1701758 RepID=A0ABW5CMN2_9HYPH|nr:anti-sigma factor [Aureimonas populi]
MIASGMDPERDEDFLAPEYVLGTLDAAGRERARRRLAGDPAFASEVEAWARHLAPMASAVEPVSPPAAVWRRIEAALPQASSLRDAPRALVDAIWRRLAIGSMALAAASLAALAFVAWQPSRQAGPVGGVEMSTAIMDEDGAALVAALVDAADGSITLVPMALPDADGHTSQLWLVPGEGPPRSLGLVDRTRPTRLALPADLSEGMMSEGAVLAVSLEPAGGSPTGQPTGPVLGHGSLGSL